jgi:hypothetical protein
MRIEISIESRHVLIILLFITAASAVGLVVAYGGSAPAAMGHSWSEVECNGCIATGNLAESSVTGLKLADNSVTGFKIGCDSTLCRKIGCDSALCTKTVNKFGIGTVNPEARLDVSGNIHATEDICTDAGGGVCLSNLSAWGNLCNGVWSGCSVCCGSGTMSCTYAGRELTVRGTTVCLQTASSSGSCGSKSCSDYSCCSSYNG